MTFLKYSFYDPFPHIKCIAFNINYLTFFMWLKGLLKVASYLINQLPLPPPLPLNLISSHTRQLLVPWTHCAIVTFVQTQNFSFCLHHHLPRNLPGKWVPVLHLTPLTSSVKLLCSRQAEHLLLSCATTLGTCLFFPILIYLPVYIPI